MPVEFEIKKVPMETLGEYLFEVRTQLNLTLEEVSKKTSIYEKFIHNIEGGKYAQLPPDVYVQGFLKKLAEVYKIPPQILLDQLKKERGVVESVARERISPSKNWKKWIEKITITPKLVTISLVAVVGLVGTFYVAFQVFAINKTPSLEIFEPKNDSVISGSKISVSGKTEIGMTITINNQNILVNRDGTFQTEIGVVPGQKDIVVEAQNKLGKKKTEVLGLRVEEPRVLSANTDQETEKNIELVLQFTKATNIEVVKDGIDIPKENVPAGATKTISANESIILKTDDAGSINGTLDGVPIGVLGKKNETLTIPFTKNSSEITKNTKN